jgi:hypothetical protein
MRISGCMHPGPCPSYTSSVLIVALQLAHTCDGVIGATFSSVIG